MVFNKQTLYLLTFIFGIKTVLGYYDLGYGVDERTPVFPGLQKFKFTRQYAAEVNGLFRSSNDFKMGEHTGTHLDAPYHFNPKGRKVGEIPLTRLIPHGMFVDASKETGNNPEFTLPVSKLVQWEKDNGPVKDNTVLLVSFGWASRYPDLVKYYGGITDRDLNFPGLSEEAVDWIINTKKIVGVGVDTPSVDPGRAPEYKGHVKLSQNDIYILENVNLTAKLGPKIELIIMPMKLVNGTGAPTRIIAL